MRATFAHRHPRRIRFAPTTERGRRAVALAVLAVGLTLAWSLVPLGAALGFLAGVAGGIYGLAAIVRDHERAVAVWLTLVPFLLVVAFVIGEIAFPH